MNDQFDIRIGALAVASGFTTHEQIKGALMQQSADPGKRLGEILIERRALTPSQLNALLRAQAVTRQEPPGSARTD